MPTYSYTCDACGESFEKEQRISEEALKKCELCGKLKARRQIVSGNFILKGGGWYSDGYGSGGSKSSSGTNGSKTDSSSESKASDASSKPESSKSESSKSESSKSESGKSESGKSGTTGSTKSVAAE